MLSSRVKRFSVIVFAIIFCFSGNDFVQGQSTGPTNLEVISTDYTVDYSNDGETPTRGGGGNGGGNPGGMMIIMMRATNPQNHEVSPVAATTPSPAIEERPIETTQQVESPAPTLQQATSTPVEQTEISPAKPVDESVTESTSETIQSEPIVGGDLSANTENLPVNPKAIAIAVGAIALASFAGIQVNNMNSPENKAKRKGKRCMHVGAIIEANLREITSLEEKVQDMLKDKIQSKRAGKLIKIIKKLKDKQEKYTKLFEDCVVKKDEKKKVVTIHSDESDETKSWTDQLGEEAKKIGFEHESVHISNPRAMDIVKKANKNTMFVLHGDTSHAVAESIKSSGQQHIASSDLGEVVEKFKAFK
jgi:hypothetical protein